MEQPVLTRPCATAAFLGVTRPSNFAFKICALVPSPLEAYCHNISVCQRQTHTRSVTPNVHSKTRTLSSWVPIALGM